MDNEPLTVGRLRMALQGVDPDVEIYFGESIAGLPLRFNRFKWRDKTLLQIHVYEDRGPPEPYRGAPWLRARPS